MKRGGISTMVRLLQTKEAAFGDCSILPVGFVVLTSDQNEELEYPTMNISTRDQRPLIQLDVFHQIHCLDSLRKAVYKKVDPNDDYHAKYGHLGMSIE